jgi:Protein of unknown function (DUF4231)
MRHRNIWGARVLDHEVSDTVVSKPKHPTWERLEDQIEWYDHKSQIAQRRYKILKMAQVIIAGLIPLVSIFPIPETQFKWAAVAFGLFILVIEAVQQLNQDQQNWIAYRSTCEALKHEKYLYLAAAGPYGNAENTHRRLALLADRIEGLISQEHAKWVSAQEQALASNRSTVRHSHPTDEGRASP